MAAAGGGGAAPPPQEEEEEKRGKEIWNVAAFALMMADPFIEGKRKKHVGRWGSNPRYAPTPHSHSVAFPSPGTELEVGHVAQSASVLGFLLHKLLTDRGARARLGLFSDGCVIRFGRIGLSLNPPNLTNSIPPKTLTHK